MSYRISVALALFWMSAPRSEQISSNTPFAGVLEPVMALYMQSQMFKLKCSGVETLKSRKFTVSGDMTVHDECIQEKTAE